MAVAKRGEFAPGQTPPVAGQFAGAQGLAGDELAAARPGNGPVAAPAAPVPETVLSLGRELFARTWRPDDPRCHGGDGLGPLYNATSCLACHGMVRPGGAGPLNRNVELVALAGRAVARRNYVMPPLGLARRQPDPDFLVVNFFGGRATRDEVDQLATVHPAFKDSRSIVLHRYATDPEYASWRSQVKLRCFELGLAVVRSERNAPALFGAGLIDEVPNAVFEETARQQPSEIRGRVHRIAGGQIGRFGWKAQIATLQDFVMTACAGELGLEVPGHHQAISPLAPAALARGPDLTDEECDALVAYVRSLPRPVEVAPKGSGQPSDVEEGRKLFAEIGCADCHAPSLGGLEGIYSDLLLHDMGLALSDDGNYYSNDQPGNASNTEWRTPPLWGFRDSGPYLHDGRARNLIEAVAHHEGQAAASARRFHRLSPKEHHCVVAFLGSLAAPPPEGRPARAGPESGANVRATTRPPAGPRDQADPDRPPILSPARRNSMLAAPTGPVIPATVPSEPPIRQPARRPSTLGGPSRRDPAAESRQD